MLCQNCGENEANVKYTQIINGVKRQMSLCDECAKELGIENINFNMPISFSSFLGDMFDMYEDTIPTLAKSEALTCNKCNTSYDEFLSIGKFGCDNCYEVFKTRLDSVLKNIHGANRHVGRIGRFVEKNKTNQSESVQKSGIEKIKTSNIKEQSEDKMLDKEKQKLKILEERLKQEIKEERYEDAAKTRDEIKNIKRDGDF